MASSPLLEFLRDTQPAFRSKTRLSSLYADFSALQATNPDGYAANIETWRTGLLQAARAGLLPGPDRLNLHTSDELTAVFEIPGLGRPLALQAVIDDAILHGQLIPFSDFLSQKSSVYDKGWLPRAVTHFKLPTIGDVARWSLRQIGIGASLSDGHLEENDLVIFTSLEAAAKAILTAIRESAATPSALVFSSTTFAATVSAILSPTHLLTPHDTEALLTHLRRDQRAISVLHNTPLPSDLTIKFSPSAGASPTTITAYDTTVASLNTILYTLTTQTTALNVRIKTLDQACRAAISSKPPQKTRALALLRSKKMAEATLNERDSSEAQVRRTLDAIDAAAGQVEIVRAMSAGADVLRDLGEQVGGVEGVQVVVDKARQQMDQVEEMTKVIFDDAIVGSDDSDLDLELKQLEEDQQQKVQVTLPDVPAGEVEMKQSQTPGEQAQHNIAITT